MPRLPEVSWIAAAGPISADRIRRGMAFGVRLVFWLLVLLAAVLLALQLGVWQTEFKIAGPFPALTNPARHSLIVTVPPEGPAAWWRQPLIGDTSEKPFESTLGLTIGGHEMGPPHSSHEAIREGTTGGFSHWGSYLIFSLPPGVKNAPETIATLHYSLQPRPWVTSALMVSGALFGFLLYRRPLGSLARRVQALAARANRYGERPIAVMLRAPYLILLGLCGLALMASSIYVASSLYALAAGWALPTAALIHWSPFARWAAVNELYLGHLILTCAGFGAIATWLAGSNPLHRRSIEADERMLRHFLLWSGFPITACAFVFSTSAMWAGLARPGDLHFSNIGGLIPFSDAANYLTAAHDQAKDGIWNETALRRPLGAAFRSVLLVIGNFSLQSMLILQACLVAGAACFAVRAVMLWRGVWAGIAFFALVYIYSRSFGATPLTESLGIFWALLSIPFFIEAIIGGLARPALVGFAMTIVALMTRMGSMFTIPALLLWLVWHFGRGAAGKVRIFAAAAGILLAIFGLNSLLQSAYGTGQGATTGNFSYQLCGLSMGTGWEGCIIKLKSEGRDFPAKEPERVKILQAMAWENLRSDTTPFFGRLAENIKLFAQGFPDVMSKGYRKDIQEPGWLYRNLLLAISSAGLLYLAMRRANATELGFWALFWASIIGSASIVYLDDGARTLAASQPLIALFFAIGLSGPGSATPVSSPRPLWRYGSLGLVLTAALFVCIPWAAHRFSPIGAIAGDGLLLRQNEAIVLGGRRMSGFLVVEDGLPLRNDVPSLHLADFDAIVRKSGVEYYQGLLHPVAPPLPFGFVFAPRVEKGVRSLNQYIVPAEVMERRDVPVWRFQLKRWGYTGLGEYWYYVTNAEPWRR